MNHKISKTKTLTALIAFVATATNLCAYASSYSDSDPNYYDDSAPTPRRYSDDYDNDDNRDYDYSPQFDKKPNAFAIYGFYGCTVNDSEIEYYGACWEYRRALIDTRTSSSSLGNRLHLVARLGWASGYYNKSSWKLDEYNFFFDIGATWELQITRYISFVAGAAIGPRYVDYNAKYRGYLIDDDNMIGFGYMGTAGFNFDVGGGALEIGVEARCMANSDLEMLSKGDLSYIAGKIGISWRF